MTRERDVDDRRKVIVSVNDAAVRRDMAPHYAEKGAEPMRALQQFDKRQLEAILQFLEALASGP